MNLVNVEGQEIEIIPSGYYERPGFIGINAKELGGSANANDNSWGAAFAAKK